MTSEPKLLIEDVETGRILGQISELARSGDESWENLFERFYALNKVGYVNFLTSKKRYLVGNRFRVMHKKWKLLRYSFRAYLNSATYSYFGVCGRMILLFFSSLHFWIIFISLAVPSFIAARTVRFFAVYLLVALLCSSSLLIHELGHYLVVWYYKIPSIILVGGGKISVMYDSNNPTKVFFISVAGFATNNICSTVFLATSALVNDVFLRMLLLAGLIIQIFTMVSIIPLFDDGKNLVWSLRMLAGKYNLKQRKGEL